MTAAQILGAVLVVLTLPVLVVMVIHASVSGRRPRGWRRSEEPRHLRILEGYAEPYDQDREDA